MEKPNMQVIEEISGNDEDFKGNVKTIARFAYFPSFKCNNLVGH